MDNIQTMNLMNNSDDSGMVAIQPPQAPQQPPPPIDPSLNEKNEAEKNISQDINRNETKMDSTPIDEVMGPAEPIQMQAPAQDPRVIQPPVQVAPQIPVAPGQPPAEAPKAADESKKVMNLTNEQLEALMVGAICAAVMSRPLQEKLFQIVPQFLNEDGSKSAVGLAITGLLAAALFFFSRKFLMKN
jgi:hypothetical protein